MIRKKKITNQTIQMNQKKMIKDQKNIEKDRIAMQKRNDNKKMSKMPFLNNMLNNLTQEKIKEKEKGLSIYESLISSFRNDIERISNEIEIHQNMTVKEFRSKLIPSLTDLLVGTKFPTLKEISQQSTNFNTLGYNSLDEDSDENEE